MTFTRVHVEKNRFHGLTRQFCTAMLNIATLSAFIILTGCDSKHSANRHTEAEGKTNQRVATASLEKIMKESKFGQIVEETTKRLRSQLDSSRQAMIETLKRETEELKKISGALSKEAQQSRARELENKGKKLEEEFRKLKDSAEKKLLALRREFLLTIQEAVSQVAEQSDLDLVIDTSAVLFRDRKLDISDEIVELVDRLKADIISKELDNPSVGVTAGNSGAETEDEQKSAEIEAEQ